MLLDSSSSLGESGAASSGLPAPTDPIVHDGAEEIGDEPMAIWAHNCRVLMSRPEIFDYADWIEGGLVRHPRRLGMFRR